MIALIRTEFAKAFWRTRTVVLGLLLVALPGLLVYAIRNRPRRPARGGEYGLFRLSHESGLVVPGAVLGVTSGFLLVVVAGLFAGDSVAGDASWGNLRYVLLRPVGRLKLLAAKALVAAFLIWACVALVALTALAAGVWAFGAHPLVVPSFPFGPDGHGFAGFTLSTGTILARTLIATAYVAFGFTALLGIGLFVSTLVDAPAGAIGSCVGVYVVSSILDGIEELGRVRYAFPTHHGDVWRQMFTRNRFPTDMWVGIGVQSAWLVVFGSAAALWFSRKDIKS